jgi:hypothetical protein
MQIFQESMKPDKFHRRCCFNCTHHLDYHMDGRYANTVVCSIRAEKDMGNYIGVDYSQRIAADHPPCSMWQVDTNIPKGCHWGFTEPKQLTIQFD